MAGTATHAYFAVDLYNKLDKKSKERINIETIKTFAQGHDIFFFTFNFINHKTKNIGSFMHKNNTRDFFKNIVIYIKENNLQNNEEIMSFLYGQICHYVLDSIVHPYVTYKTGVYHKNKKETLKYNSKHSDLETYIDAYYINKNENIEPNKFKIQKFCFNTKISKELATLIDEVYYKTYNFKHISLYVKEGIFKMKHEYALLRYDPHKIKMKMYRIVDKILPKTTRKMYPISYAYNLDKNEYYLNLNHKTWNHPRVKEETYTYSFLDLYDNAINEGLKIISEVNKTLYENKPIKELDKVFLNISYSSGKECNDKRKNKYFEY